MAGEKRREIVLQTEFIKLDQLLKFTGIADTGGQAKEMVIEGYCQVNGEVCTQRGKKLRPGDEIAVLLPEEKPILLRIKE